MNKCQQFFLLINVGSLAHDSSKKFLKTLPDRLQSYVGSDISLFNKKGFAF